MGIRSRDYMKDWRPEDAELPSEDRPRTRKPWTRGTWVAVGSLLLLLLAIVAVAVFRPR